MQRNSVNDVQFKDGVSRTPTASIEHSNCVVAPSEGAKLGSHITSQRAPRARIPPATHALAPAATIAAPRLAGRRQSAVSISGIGAGVGVEVGVAVHVTVPDKTPSEQE